MFIAEAKGLVLARSEEEANRVQVSATFATREDADQFAQMYREAHPQCVVIVRALDEA